jgi:hypothetical protein
VLVWSVWVAACAVLLSGCGGSGTLVPVSGEVLLDGSPLKAGSVSFHADATKGNTSQDIAAGQVNDGKFELYTGNKKGARPGAYKVVVVASEFSGKDPPPKGITAPVPKMLIHLKYTQASTTPLSAEVVERPAEGAYTFKVTKP